MTLYCPMCRRTLTRRYIQITMVQRGKVVLYRRPKWVCKQCGISVKLERAP